MSKGEAKGTRTYRVERGDDETLYITVPEDYKVTFGPVAPGMNEGVVGKKRQTPYVLRFYETKEKQRGLIRGVTGFYDTSFGIETESERQARGIAASPRTSTIYTGEDDPF